MGGYLTIIDSKILFPKLLRVLLLSYVCPAHPPRGRIIPKKTLKNLLDTPQFSETCWKYLSFMALITVFHIVLIFMNKSNL